MKKEEKNKNSLKSIMIIILYFIFPYLMKFLSGIKWLTLLFYMLFVLLIIYLYKDTFKNDFKDLKENKKKYIKSILINVVLIFAVMIITNALIVILLNINETSENDYSLLTMFKKSPLALILLTSVYYPLVEGVIFRKSVRDIIDNKWTFIIFSSVFYFFFNIAYTSLSLNSIITSLCYLFSMMILSNYYYKSNNFTASVIVMMIYNLIISVISFI
ncbi:cAAX amino terminal protease family protein [Clostridium sp. CAG:594]|nr:cAAX amino terminal protease family protein [Clostridium sp. CAG:594]